MKLAMFDLCGQRKRERKRGREGKRGDSFHTCKTDLCEIISQTLAYGVVDIARDTFDTSSTG